MLLYVMKPRGAKSLKLKERKQIDFNATIEPLWCFKRLMKAVIAGFIFNPIFLRVMQNSFRYRRPLN